MRKRNMFRYAAVWCSAAVLLTSVSCSTDDSDVYMTGKTDDAPVMLRAVPSASEDDIHVSTRADEDKYLLDEKLWRFISNDAFIDDTTRIRLRVTSTVEDAWNFETNYYEYIYSKTLEEETTAENPDKPYNFKPWTDNDGMYDGAIGPGMTWSQLQAFSGNTTTDVYAALYAKTYSRENARTISPVQNTANHIIENDVLLAWHQIDNDEFAEKYFTLQLFHVYSMFAVEVHVPIYDGSDGLGFRETPTGGDKDTLRIDRRNNPDLPLAAESPIEKLEIPNQTLNVIFSRGSQQDSSPIATVVNGDDSELQNVEMCLLAVSPPEEEDDKKYPGLKMQKYLYACILPASGTTTNKLTVRLQIKNYFGATETYTCDTFDALVSESTNTNQPKPVFSLRQGYITLACLKLQRGTKLPVLIKGKVLPWNAASAELGLVKDGPGREDSRPK